MEDPLAPSSSTIAIIDKAAYWDDTTPRLRQPELLSPFMDELIHGQKLPSPSGYFVWLGDCVSQWHNLSPSCLMQALSWEQALLGLQEELEEQNRSTVSMGRTSEAWLHKVCETKVRRFYFILNMRGNNWRVTILKITNLKITLRTTRGTDWGGGRQNRKGESQLETVSLCELFLFGSGWW